MIITIKVYGDYDVSVKEEDVLTNDELVIDIQNYNGGENEYFAIIGNTVETCWSNDIGLNSRPTLYRIINYIYNHYGVEL